MNITADSFKVFCVRHPDREACTTATQIPICEQCADGYAAEGRATAGEQTLQNRPIFRAIIDAARAAKHPSATKFRFYGY